MSNCFIRPIPIMDWEMDQSMATYRCGFGKLTKKTAYVWFIEGLKEKTLVDAGASAQYFGDRRGIPATQIQSIESGLGKLGISTKDIGIVILTHMHSDHIALARELTSARFVVQKDELDFALSPHPTVAGRYSRKFFEGLKFETIHGDTQIFEELSVISTPGHTIGGQSVCVKTHKGLAIISGICTSQENFETTSSTDEDMEVIPPGGYVNLFAVYDSLLRIKSLADVVISNHDPVHKQRVSLP